MEVFPRRSWRGLFAALLAVSFLLVTGLAEAKTPDNSFWTRNLSESVAPEELGELDQAQEIEVVGSTVHAMWITTEAVTNARKLYYRRSTDNGATWEAKQLLFTEDDINTDLSYKRMVVTGNTVHIAVNYTEGGSSWYGVLGYLRSIDNGGSFEPIRILFQAASPWKVLDVRVTASDGKVTIGCRNQYNAGVTNDFSIYNSDDGGATFSKRTVYSTVTGSNWTVYDLHRIGDKIYVLYADGYTMYQLQYRRLYLAASSDAGAHFTVNQISVPSLDGEDKAEPPQNGHYVPKIAGVGNTVSVIWSGLDDEDKKSVFFRRSVDSGVTFGAALNLSKGLLPEDKAIANGQETLAAKGSYVYALFVSTAQNVYFRRSVDSGVTFLDMQELTKPGTTYINVGWRPVIKTDPTVASGEKVHVLWVRPTYCVSTDGGATFTRPQLVSPHFSYGGILTNGADRPQMVMGEDGKVHFVVEGKYLSSTGYGDVDVFYRGMSPAPAPSAGSNAIHLYSNRGEYRWDNMQVPASEYLNFSTEMSGEVWVRPSAGGDAINGAYQPVFQKVEQSDFTNFPYSLETFPGYYGQRQARVMIYTTSGRVILTPTGATGLVPDDSWSHLAFTYKATGGANNLKLYMNGQLIATATATGNLATGNGLLFVGRYGIYDVTELRLWNRELSQSELAANMYRSLSGSEPGLSAYYTFKNTTKDITGHGNDGILMYQEQYINQDTDTDDDTIFDGWEMTLFGNLTTAEATTDYDQDGYLDLQEYLNTENGEVDPEDSPYDPKAPNVSGGTGYNANTDSDTDDDTLPDTWEMTNFGNLTSVDDTTDYDQDGYSDLQEYLNAEEGEADPKDGPYDPKVPNAPGGTGYIIDTDSDTDDDAIADTWEMTHFGNLTSANGTTDYDQDGYTDLQEYLNAENGEVDPKDSPYDPKAPNASGGTGYIIDTDSDTDDDAIADAWEMTHFGNLSTADGTTDYDQDGYTDLQEYLNDKGGETDPQGGEYDPKTINAPEGTGYVDYDTDDDTIFDAWEMTHFNDLTTADGTTDYDRDGYTDLQEYLNDKNEETDPQGGGYDPKTANAPGGTGYVASDEGFWEVMTPVIINTAREATGR